MKVQKNIHKSFEGHVDKIVDAKSMNEAVGFSYQLAQKGDAGFIITSMLVLICFPILNTED